MDNESEFTHIKKTDRVHPLDMFLQPLGITHQLIRPRTPRHNGKVERITEMIKNAFITTY
jgi:transposase